jgi:folate-binding protein YgfZ
MRVHWNSVPLDFLGVLRVHGAQAHAFLQGQLSNDMSRLTPEHSLLAGYHNPQGRVIALMRLVALANDDVLAVLPRELIGGVASRLGKFILRAKVKLQDESAQWKIEGLLARASVGSDAEPDSQLLPASPAGVRRVAQSICVRLGGSPARLLVLRPAAAAALEGPAPTGTLEWELAAIGAGEPQVYAQTTEEFVAQMLNLDLLDAIAFDKGCYTGQEIIARAHYRGRMKRRMQRFVTSDRVQLQPGTAGRLADGRPFKVVAAAGHADGRTEFLAVTPIPGAADTAEAEVSESGAPAGALSAAQLPLPYLLPA